MSDNINKNMTFGEIMKNFPKSVQIMAKYGLHCVGWRVSNTETLGEGAMAHGFSDDLLNKMIEELNTDAV